MKVKQHAHELVILTAHPSGDEEWLCPICGERFLLKMPARPCSHIPHPAGHSPGSLTWDDPALAPWKAFLQMLEF